MLYYLDACIWIDYLEDRRDKFRPLGEWACRLINQILDSDDYFMLTDILFDELKKHLSDNRLSELAQLVADLLYYVDPQICNGRLTLSTGVPVTTADVSSSATLYFAP